MISDLKLMEVDPRLFILETKLITLGLEFVKMISYLSFWSSN